MLTFTKVFHEGKEQGLSLAHETALNQRGVIFHVGDNLGCIEYNIVQGFSWADVDVVLAEVNAASAPAAAPWTPALDTSNRLAQEQVRPVIRNVTPTDLASKMHEALEQKRQNLMRPRG